MKKALLISEKPDLMRKMERAYKKHASEIPYEVDFVSQAGHLVELLTPDEINPAMKKRGTWDNLPFNPEDHGGWQYKLIEQSFSKKMFNEIKKALKTGKYDFIINDGDPDQEGQLLIHNVLDYLGNKLPVKRVWTNDVTEGALVDAMKNLMDDDKDPMLVNLLSAAHAREHSDYRVGMNISRAADLLMHRHDTSCGRVMTPMLYLIVKREKEIRDFKPTTSYGVVLQYEEGFEGRLIGLDTLKAEEAETEKEESAKKFKNNYSEDNQELGAIWFDKIEEAEAFLEKITGNAGMKIVTEDGTIYEMMNGHVETVVETFKTEEVKTYAPKLYKLSTIQTEADRRFGMSASRTLKTIQKLYEHEYVSYPRTGCEYLSSRENFSGILTALGKVNDFSGLVKEIKSDSSAIPRVRNTKKWINDAALQQAGHSALRPTVKTPDMSKLTSDEKLIYWMISERFLAIFLPPMLQNRTELIADLDGNKFRSTGKTLVDPGYTRVFQSKFTDKGIPAHKPGDQLEVKEADIRSKTTKCPGRYTTGTLISACENPLKYLDDQRLEKLGRELRIGTDATRSSIIEKLIKKEYVEGGRELAPTAMGENLIEKLDGMMITRVDMTGIWQEKLDAIKDGKLSREDFEMQMMEDTTSMIEEIKKRTQEEEANIERVDLEWNGNPASFKREWGNHRFTDEEVASLVAGQEISFESTTKTGETYIFTGMLSGKKALKFKTTAMKKLGEEYVKGVFRKKEVEIPRDFRGHKLTDEECQKLFAGEEVLVEGLEASRKKGVTYAVNIHLAVQKGMVVFKTSLAKDPNKEYASGKYQGKTEVTFSRVWGGHRFSDQEVEKLLAGEELELREMKSKKGKTYGVVGKLTAPKNGNSRFIKVRWLK